MAAQDVRSSPGRILLVGQGGGGAAVAGLEGLEVAADLARAQFDPLLAQGRAELATGPGALLGQQWATAAR